MSFVCFAVKNAVLFLHSSLCPRQQAFLIFRKPVELAVVGLVEEGAELGAGAHAESDEVGARNPSGREDRFVGVGGVVLLGKMVGREVAIAMKQVQSRDLHLQREGLARHEAA